MGRKLKNPPVKKRLTPEEKKILSGIEHMDESKADKSFYNPDQEYYQDLVNNERIPVTIPKLERLAKDLIDWAMTDPSATRVSKFFTPRGIDRDTVCTWCKKYPFFKKIYALAKQCIADRLFDGVLTRAYSDRLIPLQMNMLDEEWKEESVRVANIKEEQRIVDLTRPLKIIMQDFSKEEDE